MYQGDRNDAGERHGHGIFYYPNNFFVYEGDYVNGKKHGKGIFKFGDGGYFEGEFRDDEITGKGIRRYCDGSTYTGEFVMGEKHGNGVFHKSSGDTYQGEWKLGRLDGRGESKIVKEDSMGLTEYIYEGDFKNHKYEGRGMLQIRSDAKNETIIQKGDFKDGILDGEECCFEIIFGEKKRKRFLGSFQNGLKNGAITCVLEDADTQFEEYDGIVSMKNAHFEMGTCKLFPTHVFCRVVENEYSSKPSSGRSSLRGTKKPKDLKKAGKKKQPVEEEGEKEEEDPDVLDYLYGQKTIEFTVKEGNVEYGPLIECFLTSEIVREKKKIMEEVEEENPVITKTSPKKKSRGGKSGGKSKSKKSKSAKSKKKVIQEEEEIDENQKKLKKFYLENGRVINCRLMKMEDEYVSGTKKKKGKKSGREKLKEKKNVEKTDEEEMKKEWTEEYEDFVMEEIKQWKEVMKLDGVEFSVFEDPDLEGLEAGYYMLRFEDLSSVNFCNDEEDKALVPFHVFFQVVKGKK